MKPWRLLLAAALLIAFSSAQLEKRAVDGTWQGTIISGPGKIRRILYVTPRRDGTRAAAIINPDNANAVTVDSMNVSGDSVVFESKNPGLRFEGTLSADGMQIKGKLIRGESTAIATWTRVAANESKAADDYEKQEFMVPMRDGVKLHTVVYSPKASTAALPFLIERSPYGWDAAAQAINLSLADLASEGYLFVFQDIRGRYKSEGRFVMLRPVRDPKIAGSVDEGTDTYDTIEWLLKNIPGNNGKAGIMGISYEGWLTEMALIEPHPALRAASEQASPADMFLGDDFHHNGAFRLSYGFEYAARMETGSTNKDFDFLAFDTYDWYLRLGPLSQANIRYLKGERPTWNNFVAHPNYDDFWQKLGVQHYVERTKVPNLNVGGWFDQEDFAGPWRIFSASETPESRQYNYLIVGPWNHGGWATGPGQSLKDIDFGSTTGIYFREKIQARWFAYWLKGKGVLDLPRIHLFETGANEWRAYDQWPPRGVENRKLYFMPAAQRPSICLSKKGEHSILSSLIRADLFHIVYARSLRLTEERRDGAHGWSMISVSRRIVPMWVYGRRNLSSPT